MTRNDNYANIVRFHGHECPGAGLGLRIAEIAIAHLGRHEPGNEIVAVSETDSCAVDAIQVLTGCTYGKRNLVHENNGKNAFTFWRRTDGAGVRVKARPGSDAFRDEQTWELAEKVEAGTATDDDRRLFTQLQAARTERILAAPAEELLIVDDAIGSAPAVKALRPSEPCDDCGDQTSVAILHNHRGKMLCPPCHLAAHSGTLPSGHAHDHDHPRARAHHHH